MKIVKVLAKALATGKICYVETNAERSRVTVGVRKSPDTKNIIDELTEELKSHGFKWRDADDREDGGLEWHLFEHETLELNHGSK